MDIKLQGILESLLRNVAVLNTELLRLGKCDAFTPTAQSLQLMERIREECLCSLQNIRTIERGLFRHRTPPENPGSSVVPWKE